MIKTETALAVESFRYGSRQERSGAEPRNKPLDIRQLRYFEAVARLGSFTSAASKLAVAQPALGVQVRKLEEELGTKLFTRSARGAELTDSGRALYESACRILGDVEATRTSIRDMEGPVRGPVRLGLASSVSAAITVPLVELSRALLPRVQLTIAESLSSDLIDSLLAGRIDMAIAFNVAPTAGLSSRMLLYDEAALIEQRSSAADDGPIELAEALSRPLIMPSRAHRLRVNVDQQAKKLGLAPKILFEVQWPTTTLALVERGYGATIMSRVAARHMASPNLVFRPIVRPRLRSPLFIARRESGRLSKADKAIYEILEKAVADAFRKEK